MSAGLYQYIKRDFLNPDAERQRPWRIPDIVQLRRDSVSGRRGYFVGYEPETELASFHDWKVVGNKVMIYMNRWGLRRKLYKYAKYPDFPHHRYVWVKNRCFRYMDQEDVMDYAFEYLNTREGLPREEYSLALFQEDMLESTAFAPTTI